MDGFKRTLEDRQRVEVLAYMRREIEYHVDARTGEVNSTTLAEDAISRFKILDQGDGAPVWDWACEVAWERED